MSALDGRIRKLAREEAEQAVKGVGVLNTTGLQQQITDLHEHLHHAATTIARLEARVDVLEKAPAAAARRRAVGKASGAESSE